MSKSAINILQEYYQSRGDKLPVYNVSSTGPPHNPEFTCEVVTCNGIRAEGKSNNKKIAKENCAQEALKLLHSHIHGTSNPHLCSPSNQKSLSPSARSLTPEKTVVKSPLVTSPQVVAQNYIGKLNEYAAKKSLRAPDYNEINSIGTVFQTECIFRNFKTMGTGSTKKLAKHVAAEQMWLKVKNDISDEYLTLCDVPDTPKKLVLIGENTMEVVDRFKQLTLKQPPVVEKKKITTYKPISLITEERGNLEWQLKKLNFQYTFTVFQKHPLIMKLQGGHGIVLFESGDNREKLEQNLLEKALEVIKLDIKPEQDLISFD